MKITMFLPYAPDRRWHLASQAGVTHAVVKLASELTGRTPPWDYETLLEAQNRFHSAGLVLYGLEGDQFDMSRIKLGLKGREDDIVLYQEMIRNMGTLKIPLLCYNFMAGIGWYRTEHAAVTRGAARTTAFRIADLDLSDGRVLITREHLWQNYTWFLEKVLPVAEEVGVVLALHPDDPPLPFLGGYARIFCNADGFRKALTLSSSPAHQITFCQANFHLMGEDVPALIHEWSDRIAFYHFRDICGAADNFIETFHDDGQNNMVADLIALRQTGFSGPIRTDHAPFMAGEGETADGYGMLGHIFALGYLKGILASLDNQKDE
ncbi:MAG: mannonate dehydratase [Planctomycetia bacterium]|nr:mannonate dehydratase [Planctomycetia bacterium]